ncbi:MAG: hypothetical protein LBQ43_02170 [Holosporales bacterium]|jgi:hypothetical protein|nr:hypothetical protein [Holosporales bacterium]
MRNTKLNIKKSGKHLNSRGGAFVGVAARVFGGALTGFVRGFVLVSGCVALMSGGNAESSASVAKPVATAKFPVADAKSSAPDEELSAAEIAQMVAEVERFMNGVYMLSGTFTQVVVQKKRQPTVSKGNFYMQRPPGFQNNANAPVGEGKSGVATPSEHGPNSQSRAIHEGSLKIRIDLPTQQIFILNEIMHVVDLTRGKSSNYCISSMPILCLFSNKLDINKNFKSYTVNYDKSIHGIYITLKMGNPTEIVLLFSLYAKNKNIEALLGWNIKDAQGTLTNVVFDKGSLVANNVNALPPNVFAMKHIPEAPRIAG